MDIVQVELPDDLKDVIDRQVAEGHAASEADFLREAARVYADHLDAENEIAAMIQRADDDVAAERYVRVATPADSERLHQEAMARLRTRLASDAGGH